METLGFLLEFLIKLCGFENSLADQNEFVIKDSPVRFNIYLRRQEQKPSGQDRLYDNCTVYKFKMQKYEKEIVEKKSCDEQNEK